MRRRGRFCLAPISLCLRRRREGGREGGREGECMHVRVFERVRGRERISVSYLVFCIP
jgi:hypothetical protein